MCIFVDQRISGCVFALTSITIRSKQTSPAVHTWW